MDCYHLRDFTDFLTNNNFSATGGYNLGIEWEKDCAILLVNTQMDIILECEIELLCMNGDLDFEMFKSLYSPC